MIMNDIAPVSMPLIIPAYEPDERLIDLLKSFDKSEVFPCSHIILVNDGSGPEYDVIFERAMEIIRSRNGVLLKHEINKGKGRALKTAFRYVIENIPESVGVITADSDGQHTTDCISKVADAFRLNSDCLILGVRCFEGDDIPWKSKFGNELTKKVMRYVSGLDIADTQTGLRGIPLAFMKELTDFGGDRFEFETQMLLATSGKYEIKQVQIATIYESRDNHQTHFNPFSDSVKIYRILFGQFFGFILSSLSSFVVDIAVFALICFLLDGTRGYILISTIVARITSSVFNYAVNYKKVFRSERKIRDTAMAYFILAVIIMGLSAGIVTGLVHLFGGGEIIIKILTDTVLFLLSFKVQQKFIFQTKRFPAREKQG